ncbi:MAG: lysine--tRNA ligase, partial [Candidatus Eisenbacteria sp.]|nr:lysine--tRNA ligase [Candidatus Eisenbacteria bacterium]
MENNEKSLPAQMRENLARLRELGVEPYPRRSARTHTAEAVVADFDALEGAEVTVAGRLMAIRGHGKAGFADLVDGTGKIQLYVRKDDVGEELFEIWKLLDVGDIVEAKGEAFRTRSGEASVRVKGLAVLAKALLPLPEKWHGLKDKELRYRQRYLDLIANA